MCLQLLSIYRIYPSIVQVLWVFYKKNSGVALYASEFFHRSVALCTGAFFLGSGLKFMQKISSVALYMKSVWEEEYS